MPMFVIEGADGSGKATQATILERRLSEMGCKTRLISFPAYDEPSSALVKMYLNGDFGKDANSVNPYSASLFYTVDRFATFAKDWGEFYRDGGIVICDRYTTANALHQAAKLQPDERKAFLDWLYDLEYNKVGLPKPDKVIYLAVPPEVSAKLTIGRKLKAQTDTDIHENLAFQRRTWASAQFVAQHGGWQVVNCTDGDEMRSIESIADEIFVYVKPCI